MAEDMVDVEKAAKNYWSSASYAPGGVIREIEIPAFEGGMHPDLQGIKIVDRDTHLPSRRTSSPHARLRGRGIRVTLVRAGKMYGPDMSFAIDPQVARRFADESLRLGVDSSSAALIRRQSVSAIAGPAGRPRDSRDHADGPPSLKTGPVVVKF